MTKPLRVDQLLAGYASGDAISREARIIRGLARDAGIASDVFVPADRIGPAVADDCRPLDAYAGAADDVVICHYSIGAELARYFTASPARKVLRYHNITPAHFFRGYDDRVADQLERWRAGLGEAAAAAGSVWADSEFNAAELRDLGVADVRTKAIFFDPGAFVTSADTSILERFGGPLRNILYVGRIAPNKCLEDLVLAFAWLNRCVDPATRLIVVGSEWSCRKYFETVCALASRLGLMNACFTGFLPDAQVAALYASARVLVTTSRHEGYGLPLVEAMCHGLPVIARATGGVPEALGDAGVMFEGDDPAVLAELVHRVMSDGEVRDSALQSQARRLAELRGRDLGRDFRELVGWQ